MVQQAPKLDDFEPRSGGFDDFDGTIDEVRFEMPREQYAARGGSSDPMLQLYIKSPDLELPVEQGYSLGSKAQWKIVDEGMGIVSGLDPADRKFQQNCRGYALFSAMATLIGGGDKKKGVEFFSKRGFFLTQAQCWKVPYTFHWKRIDMPLPDGKVSQALLPVAIIGEAKPETSVAGISDTQLEVLLKLAVGKTEVDLRKAILTDGVLKKDETLKLQVFNKGLLAVLEQSGKLVKDPSGKYL